MILDSSAILAILFAEPDAPVYAAAIEKAGSRRLSAATWLESAIRIEMTGSPVASMDFDAFVRESRMTIEPVDEEQVRLARAAYRAYGRGSGHPARLNFGDCFSYALAKVRDEPLLFKGDDFSRTDLISALRTSPGPQ
jgi:ribonuclease VapC